VSYHTRGCASGIFGNKPSVACDCGQAARMARYIECHGPPPTETETEEGERLAAEGWAQVSRRYRRVVRIPPSGGVWAELERVDPTEAERLRPVIAEFIERTARAALWHCGETRELSAGTFGAFRVARTAAGEIP